MAKALSTAASATVESDPSSAASSNRAASPIIQVSMHQNDAACSSPSSILSPPRGVSTNRARSVQIPPAVRAELEARTRASAPQPSGPAAPSRETANSTRSRTPNALTWYFPRTERQLCASYSYSLSLSGRFEGPASPSTGTLTLAVELVFLLTDPDTFRPQLRSSPSLVRAAVFLSHRLVANCTVRCLLLRSSSTPPPLGDNDSQIGGPGEEIQ